MNILICPNHDYVMPSGVMLQSLCANNRDSEIHLFILTDESYTKDDEKILENIVLSFNSKNTVNTILITDESIENVLKFESKRYPRSVFYRLLAAKLLPQTIDKVLYLDGDIIVRQQLKELWNIDLEGKAFGATIDAGSGSLECYNRLHYSIVLGYDNSGVMLINLKYWRDNNLTDSFFDFMNQCPNRIVLPDQDVLNYVARKLKVHIPMKYNVQSMYLYKEKYLYFSIYQYKEELDEARKDPAIIHYSGCRPWEKGCNHPFKEEFFKYRSQTRWKNMSLIKVHVPLKIKIKELLRMFLTPFGICHYEKDYFDRGLKLL